MCLVNATQSHPSKLVNVSLVLDIWELLPRGQISSQEDEQILGHQTFKTDLQGCSTVL